MQVLTHLRLLRLAGHVVQHRLHELGVQGPRNGRPQQHLREDGVEEPHRGSEGLALPHRDDGVRDQRY